MRIIEWNVGLKKNDYELICAKLLEKTPDIIVLTEVKAFQKKYKELLSDFFVFANGIAECQNYSNSNDVLIGIRKELGSDLKVEEISLNTGSGNITPDWRKIKITVNKKELFLLGIRFQNYNLDLTQRETQLATFYKELENKSDIIIGDFNCGSAFTIKDVSWSQFKQNLFMNKLYYYDATSIKSTFSYQRVIKLREKFIGSSPDNVFVYKESEENTIAIKKQWYQWNDEDGKWPSDHAMLIVDFELT